MNNCASVWPLLHWFRYSATKFMLQNADKYTIHRFQKLTAEMAHTDIGLNEKKVTLWFMMRHRFDDRSNSCQRRLRHFDVMRKRSHADPYIFYLGRIAADRW